ncbi:hypothetical protein ACIPY6_08110 [Streptomyces sp. NPDC090054]|uniref:hypothetical protein n=1 Tax=Streptomyces sp. NPDC090054 TaxID=3365933 RepID=UPI00380B6639
MPTEDSPQNSVKHWQDCMDVYDFLEQIRLRPGVWLPGGSLRHLEAVLTGYRVALGVHAIDESFDFWPEERFTKWLHERRGTSSSLGWAAEIERTTPPDSTPIEEFFRLLDEYRRVAVSQTPNTSMSRFPGIEYIIANRARHAAVLQRRLICLVHSDDPDIRFDPVGAMPVMWNSDEWSDANRRG